MASRESVVNRKLNPLLESLPEWVVSFREEQVRAIYEILEAFRRVDVVVLEAPTGSGKTLIAETVRRMMGVQSLYVCSGKELQDQFSRDYPYASVLKGRTNYPTERDSRLFRPGKPYSVSCGDCEWRGERHEYCSHCVSKGKCPYEVAKRRAIEADLAVLNTSYFLTETNHIGRFEGRELVIADEADLLEEALMSYVSVEVSRQRMEKYGWQPPKITVRESWREFLRQSMEDTQANLAKAELEDLDVSGNREVKYLDRLQEELANLNSELADDSQSWVFTGRDGAASFKPTTADKHGADVLWKRGKKWLLMSGTVISSESMLDSLGCSSPYVLVRVPYVWPLENRPVIVTGCEDMSFGNKNKNMERVGKHVAELIARHPGESVLVHTVSYDLTRDIVSSLKAAAIPGRSILSYDSSASRNSAILRFRKQKGSVLCAPSLDRGIDLAGDLCRVQIILKVPYPNLGDRQVAARFYGTGERGKVWYRIETIRTLMQMSGRAIRSQDDHATTYIIDSQFESSVWKEGRKLIPKWWRDTIQWRKK